MEKQTMITILEASERKKTWFKKSFQDFLNAWAKTTEGQKGSAHRYIKIADREREDGYGGEWFYLDMGYKNICKTDWALFMGQDEEEIELDEIPIAFLRQIAEELPGKITDHFKKIQSTINKYDQANQGLISLSERMTG